MSAPRMTSPAAEWWQPVAERDDLPAIDREPWRRPLAAFPLLPTPCSSRPPADPHAAGPGGPPPLHSDERGPR
jgi:hypothetical protein